MVRDEDKLRNLGIVAHINAGKTTLTERILYDTGKQRFMGDVDEGTAAMDYMREEQRRGISIRAAVTCVTWRGHRINLVDTPGHVDFTAEVERCLRVLDGVVVVLDAVRGVESQTQTVWRRARGRGIPGIVFVNKMDRPSADFEASVRSWEQRLEGMPVPVVTPVRRGGRLVGLLDVVEGRLEPFDAGAPAEVPQHMVEGARARLVEVCAEFDESLLADFVDDRPLDPDRLRAALRRATLEGRAVPVLAGAALPNRGVDRLLDAVCAYLPSPVDAGPVRSSEGDETRGPVREAPFCGLVFKVQREEDERLHFVRVYSGTLAPGDRVASSAGGEPFSVQELWRVHASHLEPVKRVFPGDVVVFDSPGGPSTGDTLFAPGAPIRLEPVRFPRPVLTMSLEPASEEDRPETERLATILAEEDPTLELFRDPMTGTLLVSGMGELHLEVFASRLQRRIRRPVRMGRPEVARLETVTRAATGAAECRRHEHGAGVRWMRVQVALDPVPGAGRAWVEDAGEGPERVRAVCREALEARLRSGLVEPWPAVDVRARLVRVESGAEGEEAAVLALEALDVACRKAASGAGVTVLEPTMAFQVECPGETLSAVLADLRARGARIRNVESGGDAARVEGVVRLRDVLGYATRLRSLTRGLGSLELAPRGFEPRPDESAENDAKVVGQKEACGLDRRPQDP